jgi:hypothetical protein
MKPSHSKGVLTYKGRKDEESISCVAIELLLRNKHEMGKCDPLFYQRPSSDSVWTSADYLLPSCLVDGTNY